MIALVLLGLEQQHSPDFTLPVLCKLFCVIIIWKFTHITYVEQLLSLHGLYWSASSCLAHDSIKRKKGCAYVGIAHHYRNPSEKCIRES